MTDEEIFLEFEELSSDPIAQGAAKSKGIVEESGIVSEKEASCHSDCIESDEVIAMGDDSSEKNDGG